MESNEHIIAIPADPDDPEDGDVTEAGLQRGLAEREERLRLRAEGEAITLYLDREVLAKFRRSGPDWQNRVNEALRAASV